MKGDFSHWKFDPRDNHAGVLQQQGRVLLDRDWNAQVRISTHRADEAARNTIGSGIAAVPAGQADGFRVTSVIVGTGADGAERVELTLTPGRLWADGIPVVLSGDGDDAAASVLRVAEYLQPPLQSPAGNVNSIGAGVRDAVILEVTREALNGFQQPDSLIEPALGGPDTTERMQTRAAFRLFRLSPGEDCRSILPALRDDPSSRGRLSVRLQPTVEIAGDCPVVAGGGYTGFEHYLYRIEIARLPSDQPPHFKWSQFNGGLVGRGRLETTPNRILITANRPAIVNSGLHAFYAEVVQWDAERGLWEVTLGADVTLSNGELHVSSVRFGSFSATTGSVFFRLWNGIRPVGDFTNAANPVELLDGIQLTFPPAAIGNLIPGDYWTFDVRAGEITNPEVLLDDAPPAGPRYHRVPLAELTWSLPEVAVVPPQLEDCRRRFRPLTNQTVCCTLLVGDGIRSFGDFNCLSEAAAHLPAAGGELCLLPGLHLANLTLTDRHNVRIHGCRDRTWLFPRPNQPGQPILTLRGGHNLLIEDLQMVSFEGMCVKVESSSWGNAREVRIQGTKMLGRTHAVRMDGGEDVRITDNVLHVWDTNLGGAVVSLRAEDVLIARNRMIVRPGQTVPPDEEEREDDSRIPDSPTPEDPCATPQDFYGQLLFMPAYVTNIWLVALFNPPAQPYRAQGGLHLRGGSVGLRIRQNRIAGGASHGITLGGTLRGDPAGIVDDLDDDGEVSVPRIRVPEEGGFAVHTVSAEDGSNLGHVPVFLSEGPFTFSGETDAGGILIAQHAPGLYRVDVGGGYTIQEVDSGSVPGLGLPLFLLRLQPAATETTAAFIHDLEIDQNEIRRMGLAGIGFTLLAGTEAAPVGAAINEALAQGASADDPAAAASLILATLFSPRELVGTTNPVRRLRITRNTITGNVLNPFTEEMRSASRRIAIGGVSLDIVEAVSITENEVRENGPNAIDPTCGIFIAHGDDVDIRGNTLAANGIVADVEDYLDRRAQGLRGGIFVRFAGAISLALGSRKPALRVQNNRVDQPAGRAITAFAFGPVTCDGNYFNSERTGNWSFYDEAVGGVLILSFGGLHRALNTRPRGSVNTGPDGNAGPGNSTNVPAHGRMRAPGLALGASDFRDQSAVEMVLPGGEVMFNNNQVRLGAGNSAYTGQLIASFDDLGCDGNQSALFGQNLLFANTVLAARTIRATDSRYTEDLSREVQAGTISLLTYGGVANLTVHNQADNCIVALPHPAGGLLPTIAMPNQVLNPDFCGRFGETIGILNYVIGFLFMVQARDTQNLTDDVVLAEADGVREVAVSGGQIMVGQVYSGNAEVYQAYQHEHAYLRQHYGETDTRTIEFQQSVIQQRQTLHTFNNERELANIAFSASSETVSPGVMPTTDGRVTVAEVGGRGDLSVEYVDRQGRSLGPTVSTNEFGYYRMDLSPDEIETLAGREDVFIRVMDDAGHEVGRAPTVVDPVQPHRVNFELARPVITPDMEEIGSPIFVRPERETTPEPEPRPSPTDQPTPSRDPVPDARPAPPPSGTAPRPQPIQPQPAPTTSTPVETIRGIGPIRAAELERRGIHDVETLLRTPTEDLTGIPGFAVESAKEEGRRILEGRATPQPPPDPNQTRT